MSFLPQGMKDFFRLSDLPSKARGILEQEGLLFLAEGVRITVHYKRYKAPGRSFRNKRETSWGSLAISPERIVGYALRRRVIHLPFNGNLSKQAVFSLFEGKVLVIDVDPSIADPRREGSVQIRYHTHRAAEAYRLIKDLMGN